MNDDIKLPPLPKPAVVAVCDDHTRWINVRNEDYFTREQVLEAIKADRQQRGEPVAWRVGSDLFLFEEDAQANVRNPYLRPVPLCDCYGSQSSAPAQEPSLPEGWRIVERQTCYALHQGNEVIALLSGPRAEDSAALLAGLLAQPSAAAHKFGEEE